MTYCSAIENMTGERRALHKAYHDTLYGFPIYKDDSAEIDKVKIKSIQITLFAD